MSTVIHQRLSWPTWDKLEQAESNLCTLLALGLERDEIVRELGITIMMFYKRRTLALELLNLRNDVELTRHAIAHGYVFIPSVEACVVQLDANGRSVPFPTET